MNTLNTSYTLLDRVRKSDENAWEEFVEFYKNYMQALCFRMHLQEDDVSEVVQRVVIKLWKILPESEGMKFSKFRSWIAKVTINEAKDFIKQRNRRNIREKQYSEHQALNGNLDEGQLEAFAEKEWHEYIVKKALDNIKDNYKPETIDIFLELLNGQSISEVANKFEVPSNTVSVYKARIKKALAKEIRIIEAKLG